MSDEKNDTREDQPDVESHKWMTEEPGEDDQGKTKTKWKFKTKTAADDVESDDIGDRAKY